MNVRLTLLVACAASLGACREPTQVTVRLTTDAACGGDGFREASVAVASEKALPTRPPTASTDACASGNPESNIGTIVVVPAESDDDSFGVRVVAGIGVTAESCPAPSYVLGPEDTAAGRGCIVSRRALGFLPHTKLELPIVLRQACLNVDCTADKTCVQGACVSAKIDPEKCAEPGGCSEEELVGGGGAGGAGGMGGAGGVGGAGGLGGAGGTGGAGPQSKITQLTVGESFSCARLDNGNVACWGVNQSGAWGIGPTAEAPTPPAEVMLSLSGNVEEIAAGREHLCVRLTDGTVQCAGDNSFGQLTLPVPTVKSPTPNPITLPDLAEHIAAGENHTCVGLADSVACWGANDRGQVTLPPSQESGVEEQQLVAKHLAGGVRHTCAIGMFETVRCWGDSSFLQAGVVNADPVGLTSVLTAGGPELEAKYVSAGNQHACSVDQNDTIQCWGTEEDGAQQFGNGSATDENHLAVPNGFLGTRIAIGWDATCVVGSDGSLSCWGEFDAGQKVGDLADPDDGFPHSIPTNANARDVVVGLNHACYIDVPGDVYCWGNNDDGQVTGTPSGRVFPPVQIQPP